MVCARVRDKWLQLWLPRRSSHKMKWGHFKYFAKVYKTLVPRKGRQMENGVKIQFPSKC